MLQKDCTFLGNMPSEFRYCLELGGQDIWLLIVKFNWCCHFSKEPHKVQNSLFLSPLVHSKREKNIQVNQVN